MKKSILALILVFAMVFTSSIALAKNEGKDTHKNNGRFSDIADCWAKDSIDRRAGSDIFDKSGRFWPNKQITRIEFVLLLHDAMDININYFAAPDISDTYKDMKNTDKGASQLIDLVTAGIIDNEGTFGPNEKLTREQMIHYIINALDYATDGSYPLIKMIPAPFRDDEKIDSTYKNDITIAVLLRIIKGSTNNMFYPEHYTTRAEAAAFIDRMLSFIEEIKPVNADVYTEAKAVVSDGTLKMNLTLTNKSAMDVTIDYPTSQKYDFIVYDIKGNALYTWSADKSFMFMLTQAEIESGDSVTFTETVSKADYDAIKTKAYYVRAFITGTSEDFDIDEDGYKATLDVETDVDVSVEARIVDGKLKMWMEIENNSVKDVVINHTSGQRYDFKIYGTRGNVLYTWSADKMFTMALCSTTVKAGQSVTFTDTLSKTDYDAIKTKAYYVRAFITGTSEDFDIDEDGYKATLDVETDVDVSVEARIVDGKLKMWMEIENNSVKDVVINHTSGQRFDFKVFDSKGNILYTWSADKMFTMTLCTTTVKAGQNFTFTDTLDSTTFDVIKSRMSCLKGYIVGSSYMFDINKSGYAGE